jgi:hypothetical protein
VRAPGQLRTKLNAAIRSSPLTRRGSCSSRAQVQAARATANYGRIWTGQFKVRRKRQQGVVPRTVNRVGYAGLAGSHSSTLFPSGSITQANFPYSESSIFSSTLQPSSFKALTKA